MARAGLGEPSWPRQGRGEGAAAEPALLARAGAAIHKSNKKEPGCSCRARQAVQRPFSWRFCSPPAALGSTSSRRFLLQRRSLCCCLLPLPQQGATQSKADARLEQPSPLEKANLRGCRAPCWRKRRAACTPRNLAPGAMAPVPRPQWYTTESRGGWFIYA